jgi:hypothetical protein
VENIIPKLLPLAKQSFFGSCQDCRRFFSLLLHRRLPKGVCLKTTSVSSMKKLIIT